MIGMKTARPGDHGRPLKVNLLDSTLIGFAGHHFDRTTKIADVPG